MSFKLSGPKIYCFIILLFYTNQNIKATTFSNMVDVSKDITMGIYVTSIYDINLQQNYFGIDFWIWFVYRKEYAAMYGLNPLNTVKLMDIYDAQVSESYIRIDSSLKNDYYVLKKVSAKVRNDFEIKDFPFDRQILKLKFEDAEHEMKSLKFNLKDTPYSKSGIDNNLHINGIKINSAFSIKHEPHKYQNNFGSPRSLKNKDFFDRVIATITIKREVGFLFLKIFTGLYVSFFIALLALFVHPKDLSTRFSLPVGSLFAAVGNKYFVDELMPNVNSITLADIIHTITFIYIFLIILFSVVNIYIIKSKDYKDNTMRVDIKAFWFLLISYFLLNIFFIIKAAG